MKKNRNLKIGSDPELFISTGGKVISVEGLLGGTKAEPLRKNHWQKGFAVQEDNVLAEYNTPPTSDVDKFIEYHLLMKQRIENILKENTGVHHECIIKSSHEFQEHQLASEQALLFGCDPDMNIWELEFNESPDSMQLLRTAGGHIHLGWDNPTLAEQINVTKFMDLYLGVSSVLLDKDTRRKIMYGKAGAMRFKDYGIEYRTLSNFWLKNNSSISFAFKMSVAAFEKAMISDFPEDMNYIEDVINSNDKESAKKILKQFKITI